MRLPTVVDFIGSTVRVTLVCSGATISPAVSRIWTASDTLVGSLTATDSGGGHYYFDHAMPMTPGHYVNEVLGTINANTYRRYQLIELRYPRVG